MEAVRGLAGHWHLTDGDWDESGSKLKTYCHTSISPNHRRTNKAVAKRVATCPKCKEALVKSKP